jgi:hypothetical protein
VTENERLAERWVEGLLARGARLDVRNGRLRIYPGSAYKELSDDELVALRRCRQEIKALVESGARPAPCASGPEPGPQAEAPEPKPEPVFCAWCNRAPCAGPGHPAFRTTHYNDPAEVERRRKELTRVMYATRGTTSPYL